MNSSTIQALQDIDEFLRKTATEQMDLRGGYQDGIKKATKLVHDKIQLFKGEIRNDVYKEFLASIELIDNGIKRRDFLNPRHPETWPGYTEEINSSAFTEAGGVFYNYCCMISSVIYSLLYDYDELSDFKRRSRELLFRHATQASKENIYVPLGSCGTKNLPDMYKRAFLPDLYIGTFEAFILSHGRGKAYVKIYRAVEEPARGWTEKEKIVRQYMNLIRPSIAEIEIDGDYMKGSVSFLYFTIPQTEPGADIGD